jgi:two-component system OmpR family sensor kinase
LSTFEERGISLNELEKKSFYSFLLLYLSSSALFILLLGYWYYNAQKNALESETYYKLEHLADKLSGRIINAHMKGSTLLLPQEKGFEYSLIPSYEIDKYQVGYFEKNATKILVSSAPQEHLNIEYVVVKTSTYFKRLHSLQREVLTVMGISFILIGIISFFLAKLFMRPLHNRMSQIESFIQDVSHELNTPITALKMSASRALQKEVYNKKILTNISISTKQLESIYKSLTFLNFEQNTQEPQDINLKEILQREIGYYAELTEAKHVNIVTTLKDSYFVMVPSRAELLFSNLISNAVKYSMPETTITITLKDNTFTIQDEGVGIAADKRNEIFKLYKRESNIAGGFGVGLSIVKQICNTYNIEIEVESQLGHGTLFILRFGDSRPK